MSGERIRLGHGSGGRLTHDLGSGSLLTDQQFPVASEMFFFSGKTAAITAGVS